MNILMVTGPFDLDQGQQVGSKALQTYPQQRDEVVEPVLGDGRVSRRGFGDGVQGGLGAQQPGQAEFDAGAGVVRGKILLDDAVVDGPAGNHLLEGIDGRKKWKLRSATRKASAVADTCLSAESTRRAMPSFQRLSPCTRFLRSQDSAKKCRTVQFPCIECQTISI
jgi:hypothetical protein